LLFGARRARCVIKFGRTQFGVRGNNFIQSGLRLGLAASIAMTTLVSTVENLRGQEALRISMAGDLAAEAQKQAESSIGYYNLLLGPLAWQFSSGLGVFYDDNVRAQSQNPKSDCIVRPSVNAQMHWPVTQLNSLNLSVSAGYSTYLQHSDLNQFYVDPGSGLSFNIYVGDVVVNLHDRLSITESAYQNQSANGNTIYASLQNTAGANALWDLNQLVLTLGYDHGNYMALNSSRGQPDAASENFSLNAGLRLAPEFLTGVEAGGGLVHYSGSTIVAPDAKQWNVGAFCIATISEYLNARLDAGYTMFLPDTTSANYSSGASSGFYLDLVVTHQVNRFFNYSLSAGRSIDLQYNGQPYDRYTVRCQPNWSFLKNYSISTPLWWEHGTQIYFQSATYDQYGAGISLGRRITAKLSGNLSFQFIQENSNQPRLNYTVHIVGLNLTYQF
jgi:hypothetical protein